MTKEAERTGFRPGESANRPIGGNVSDAPLPRALYRAAVVAGYESQRALAKEIGVRQNRVGNWYRGEDVPSPEVFGNLVILFSKLSDQELEPLVQAYADQLAEKEKSFSLKMSRKNIRSSKSPVGKWIEDFCSDNDKTIGQLFQMLGFNNQPTSRTSLGWESLERIRQNAKGRLGLSEEQTVILNEVIDKEIQDRKERGHRFQTGMHGAQLKKEQKALNYRTYNSAEAGRELGVTRQTIKELREKFGMQTLLTEENMGTLRGHLEKTKAFREKQQQTRIKNRSVNLAENDSTISE